jgi:hypothetical protein
MRGSSKEDSVECVEMTIGRRIMIPGEELDKRDNALPCCRESRLACSGLSEAAK